MSRNRVEDRLERLERQIGDLNREGSAERPWSDRKRRLDAAIKGLKEEAKLLREMLNTMEETR